MRACVAGGVYRTSLEGSAGLSSFHIRGLETRLGVTDPELRVSESPARGHILRFLERCHYISQVSFYICMCMYIIVGVLAIRRGGNDLTTCHLQALYNLLTNAMSDGSRTSKQMSTFRSESSQFMKSPI